MQRNHMLLVGQAMGVCLMAAIAFIIPFRRLTGRKTSPTGKEASSLHMASSSKATEDKARIENPFDQIAPSSASTSANNLPCHIFINHRGSDVKHTLASTIYHTLDSMGFRVFLDVELLQPGDVITAEIQQAMETASLHIAIFSDSYAQSPWCLAELSFMLKTGTKIIPIFYHVQPSDLRWIVEGKGIYANAFSEHEKKGRYTPEKLDEWRKALSTISGYSGYVVTNNEDEGRLLKNIVNRVLNVMKKVPFEVAKHPVGLDDFVQEFERELHSVQIQSHHTVRIAGIWGMGGSGKTTLAKELFNGNSSSFDRSSFIFDVRDAASKNALVDKQKKLLGDLDVHHLPFDNVDEGMGVLANRLNSLRVLIILDDVDHIDQLDALLPQQTNLGSGSLVIVTTRELGVLTSWGVFCIYKMPGLNHLHSQQLFCWHAFLQPSPPSGFEDLVTEFVNVCSSLPLSLKVFGGHLYGKKSKGYWRSELNKISRILPADIKQRLQVSYNALDKEEQQIFLDVACFFIGEEKSLAIAVWDGSGWSGLHSLETLLNKCLVELDDYNKIRMHDHLRDMGREIAATHSPYRFWLPKQILNMKKHSQARMSIRGISGRNNDPVDLQNCLEKLMGNSRKGFKRCRSSLGLEILHVGFNQFTEELASLSEELVWLSWSSFTERNLPSWLSLRNISVLELYGASRLEELWEDNVKPPLKLKELRIGGFMNVLQRFPCSIGRLKHLKKIVLKSGFGGSCLPEKFCGLQSLEHLALPRSRMLSSLPAHFGDLTNLRHIDLRGCERMQVLPDSFKQLIRLEYLNLEDCKTLKLRLDMLENITKLEYLNLNNCEELEELPRQITNQGSLKELQLYNCKKLRYLPSDIGQMCRLETLTIDSCPLLTSLPSTLGDLSSLTTLQISSCHELTSLPISLRKVSSLTTLHITCCKKFTSLPSFGDLSSLTILMIYSCPKLSSLPSSLGDNLTNLPRNLSSLTTLKICSFDKLEYLVRFNLLQHLAVELPLDAGSSCSTQASQISISKEYWPNLRTLFLSGHNQLVEIRTLATSVYSLKISSCHMLKNIRGIGSLVNLRSLTIFDCPELDELPSFADLASLKKFNIQGCPKIEKIEGLEQLRSLQHLIAKTRWEVVGIQSLKNVERLDVLNLRCDTIAALKPCIQSLKECPLQMELQGRAVHVVKPIVNSLEFPDLTVMERVGRNTKLQRRKRIFLCYEEEEENNDEGKVVHISVFRSVVFFPTRGDKATIVIGEEVRVMEALNKLLALLE